MAEMARLVAAASERPGAEDLLLASESDTQAWFGRMDKARELTRRAIESAIRDHALETAADYRAEAALREAEVHNLKQARTDAAKSLKLASNRTVRVMAALALARAGDTARSEKLANELHKDFPLDTLVQRYWLPTIRAAVELQRHNPSKAIELLEASRPIELGLRTQLTVSLCPVYVRGDAYLMQQNGRVAAAEFQKFFDYSGAVRNFPLGALARLGLARSYALQGDTTKARAAYQEFLAVWKDADPEIPILKHAKAEYAKLQ